MIYQALADVLVERQRQDARWGEQNHQIGTWLTILTEEIGELCRAELALTFGEQDSVAEVNELLRQRRAEAVQVAAVALAIVEYLDRAERASAEDVGLAAGSERGTWRI